MLNGRVGPAAAGGRRMPMSKDGCSWCNDPAHVRPGRSRREFLYVGLVGGLGLTLGNALGLREARGDIKTYQSVEGPAKSIIHIFLPGGISAQESFDPKPFAPIEYRGPMGIVKTALAGESFSETVPKIAAISDKITIVQQMT